MPISKPLPRNWRPTSQQQHFKVVSPRDTHRMVAHCREVDCPHYLKGWQTTVPLGSAQADYLDHQSERRFIKRIDGLDVIYVFYPGQRCFRQHSKPLFRPPILIHSKDWNGQRRVMEPNEWQDKFATTLEEIKQERGR